MSTTTIHRMSCGCEFLEELNCEGDLRPRLDVCDKHYRVLFGNIHRLEAHIEALEKVVAAIAPAREATGKFIQHIGGGKPNADKYWELRGAAEEANGKLNEALAALAKEKP